MRHLKINGLVQPQTPNSVTGAGNQPNVHGSSLIRLLLTRSSWACCPKPLPWLNISSKKVRPWVEPAQSYEKHQLGLKRFFFNSLHLTWIMALLADTVVLLRAQALLSHPRPTAPLGDLTPKQLTFSWD